LKKGNEREKNNGGMEIPVFGRVPVETEWLKKIDIDVDVDVESFSQETILADSAQFHVVMNSGLLTVSPAHLAYPNGKLTIELQLDVRDVPRIMFEANGQELDPWRTLDIQKLQKTLEAKVDVDVSIDTWGTTPHQLASNCRGNIYITSQNGKLRAALADLLFVDIVGWLRRETTGKKFYDIDCGVVDCTIDEGVISTDAFIIDTKDILITGSGTLDLGNETIQYVLLPKKKSRLFSKADPVNIDGPLNNPSVTAIPWKSAVTTFTTYGGMILAPYIFLPLSAAGHMIPTLKGKFDESPCLEYRQAHKSKGAAP
jgi:uncharacterized protein involved in outer membrane biogenesis